MKCATNLIIVFVLTCLSKIDANSRRIELHLGLNECVTCYAAFDNFSSLRSIDKVIVIAKQDSAAALEFLDNYFIPKDVKYRYVERAVVGESYCIVYSGESIIDSFSLKSLPTRFKAIEKLIVKELRLKLPPSFIVNKSRVNITVSEQSIFFFDYILNKAIFVRYNNGFDTIKKITIIKGSSLNSKEFIKKGNIDTVLYNELYSILKKIGKSDPHIESAYSNDTIISLLLYFPNPKVNPKDINDTVVGFSFFIYDKSVSNGKSRLSFVDHDSFLNQFQFHYGIRNSRPIFRTKAGLHIGLTDFQQKEEQIKLLSTWHLVDEKYVFQKLDDVAILKKYFKEDRLEMFHVNCNQDFYFNTMLSLVVDIDSGNLVNTDFLKISEVDQYALDLRKIDNTVQALVKAPGSNVQVWTIDLENNKVSNKKDLQIPFDCDVHSIRFASDGKSLICLDNSYTSLIKINLSEN